MNNAIITQKTGFVEFVQKLFPDNSLDLNQQDIMYDATLQSVQEVVELYVNCRSL